MTEEPCILVVDDEENIRNVLERLLVREGYRVLPAGNGRAALDLLAQERVDLILSDIVMPGWNGYQFYERVVREAQWAAIPFIFLTARGMDSDVRYGKELGVDDYVTKPFDRADLLAAVRGSLRRAERVARAAAQRQPPAPSAELPAQGPIRIYEAQHRVEVEGRPVQLSPKEFKLLAALVAQHRRVLNPQELVSHTHDLRLDRDQAASLVRPLVRTLRRKLGYGPGKEGCIATVRGVGYRYAPERAAAGA